MLCFLRRQNKEGYDANIAAFSAGLIPFYFCRMPVDKWLDATADELNTAESLMNEGHDALVGQEDEEEEDVPDTCSAGLPGCLVHYSLLNQSHFKNVIILKP